MDANILELLATGFMSNRGRQNVASYLVHDLGLDWRPLGAEHFEESLLVDYTPEQLGQLARRGRPQRRPHQCFNILKQSKDYDSLWISSSSGAPTREGAGWTVLPHAGWLTSPRPTRAAPRLRRLPAAAMAGFGFKAAAD